MDISILSLVLVIGASIVAIRIIALFVGLFRHGGAGRQRRSTRRRIDAPLWEQPQRRQGYQSPAPHPLPPPQDDLEYWQAAHQALQQRMPPPAPPPRPHGE